MKALLFALLLAAPVAHCQLPALPDSVPTVLGYARVELVPDLQCSGSEAYGCYNTTTRIIQVRSGMALIVAWQTLYHELGHANLHDAGVWLPADVENRIVDALAVARLAFMLEVMRAERDRLTRPAPRPGKR